MRSVTCLGLFDGLSVRPNQATLPTPHGSSKTQARGRRAMPTLPQARGELCSGDRRGERIADTVGHRAGSARRTGQALPRFYPRGWSRAITCRGVCKELADAQSGFSGPAKAILSLRTGRLGGAGNPLTCRGPISISVSAAPTCNGSGIQVARSDDAPRINGSDAQDRKGTTADQSSAEPWAAPRSYGGTSGAPAAAAVNVGQPSRAFVIAGCVRVLFLLVREYRCCFSNLAVLVLVAARVKMGSVFWARRVP